LLGRNKEKLGQLYGNHSHTELVEIDITDDQALETLVAELYQRYGKIDVLINNAGYGSLGSVEEVDLDEARRQFEVNVFGLAQLIQLVTPYMREKHAGRIINISSVGGIQAGPAQVSYFAAKGGVVNLTKAMAGDLAPYGILVNAIAPGVYDTEMTHDALDAPGSLVLKNRVALKRFGREGEMNGALIYFASDACTYTTGQLLVIDGGMTSML
jgi:gluconate 5-dehydrogenase